MRVLFVLVFLFSISSASHAQKIGEGLWNTGRAFSITPMDHGGGLVLEQLVAKVHLYPGIAAVRSEYDVVNPGSDTLACRFLWKDSSDTRHVDFINIGNLRSHAMKLLVNNDTMWTMEQSRTLTFTILFPPGDTTRITTLQITPNHQALLSKDGSLKESNAFVYSLSNSNWKHTGTVRVLVQLTGDLTLTNVLGVYPNALAKATMQQIKFEGPGLRDSTNQDLVIWYEGAAPDSKFEKKILLLEPQLYRELNTFDTALFNTPSFTATGKDDFSTNKRSPIFSFLYFLMFTVPWIILIAFVIFLVRKPKKK